MAQQSLYVCYWGNSGRHLLVASISPFDPTRTFGDVRFIGSSPPFLFKPAIESDPN
jgi:hypothetical protein